MKRIVFVCVENANRSQMAEAFLRMHAPGIVAYSAGSRPSGVVNPRAAYFMSERGYELGAHSSKGLDDLPDVEFDVAVTMGCGDECPHLKAASREDWPLPDPKHLDDDGFRGVRDDIEARVLDLIARLGV